MPGCVVFSGEKPSYLMGAAGDYIQLSGLIKEKSDSHVNARVFIYPQYDHAGAFLRICRNSPEIKSGRNFYIFPYIEHMKRYAFHLQEEVTVWGEFDKLINTRLYNNAYNIRAAESFAFDEINVTVLIVYNSEITSNFIMSLGSSAIAMEQR